MPPHTDLEPRYFMKVTLAYEDGQPSDASIDIKVIPHIGDRLLLHDDTVLEVCSVIHTPERAEHAAILNVKRSFAR